MTRNMTDDEKAAVCMAAWDVYGRELQLQVAMEELAELTVAISHYLRGRDGSLRELAEELADVEIVCKSLRTCVTANTMVDGQLELKWDRLKRRIAKDGG